MKKVFLTTFIFLLTFVMAFALFGCEQKTVYSVSLSSEGANLTVGEKLNLTVNAEGFTADSIVWASSDMNVAVVESGLVKAIGAGSATITAAVTAPDGETYKASCALYVTAAQEKAADYKIEYYKQKKDRSGYELDADLTETVSSFADRTATVLPEAPTGFVFSENNALNVLSAKVAADGSTVLKVYYDIQVITITFRSEAGADILRQVDYGDTLTDIPAVPVKPGYSGVWNVTDFSSVVAPFTVTAIYSMEYYTVDISIVSEQVNVAGNDYDFYKLDADDFTGMTASVQEDGGKPVMLDVSSSGKVTANLTMGSYTLTVTRGDITRSKQITVSGNSTDSIAFPKDIDLGGSVGDYASFASGWEKLSYNSVKISSFAYVYIGLSEEELTDRYYLEANVDFQNVGKFLGILAAAEYGDISGGDGGGKQKLTFSYSGGNKIYKGDNNSWSEFETDGYIAQLKADPANCKFAILRDGDVYYLILNDKIVGSLTSDKYGESGFGFCSMSETGTATFSNINYTIDPDTVTELKNYFTTTPSLGGSFNYEDGTVVNSFNSGTWSVKSDGASGTISGPSYIFNGGTAGNVYYAEATFSKSPQAWVGILINTLDGEPTNNKGWYGYGVYDGKTLYLHTYSGNWQDGDNKGGVSTGSGSTFKLGVARVNDYYYVFVNDVLVLNERVTAYSTSDNAQALPADNVSGFGIYIGSNFNPKNLAFSNFNFTLDREIIAEKVGGAKVAYDSEKMSVSQAGEAVASNGSVFSGIPVEINLNVPAGQVVENLELFLDGNPVSVNAADGKFTFNPVAGGNYSIEVSYTEEGEAALNLTVKPYEIDGYNLYPELTVDPALVTVTLVDMTTGTESVGNLTSLTKNYTLTNGYYSVKVEYGDNVYSYDIFLADGETKKLTGYVSPVYLGGAITIPNSEGVDTTYYSYKNVNVGNAEGGGWKLKDGQRDTVNLLSHTFVYQNEVSGTKYYLEGVFDTTETYTFGTQFGGLLVAHGPETLNDSPSDVRLAAGIFGDSLVVCSILTNWNPQDTRILLNLKDAGVEYDPTAVKLGVVRDGCNYYFFINDVFVTDYYYDKVTTECGIGLMASPAILTVSKFNYSLNTEFIDALIAKAPVEEKSIDLYFIAGQSNASGYSTFSFNTAVADNPRFGYGFNNIWYAGDAESTGSNSMVIHRDLGWQLARIGQGAAVNKFGPEAGMAEALSAYYNTESGKVAGIIKYAHGGTALLDNIGGENASNGNWVSPSYEATIKPQSPGNLTGGLYRNFLAQVEKNVAELKNMGYTTINFKGLFWMQGESDKGNPNEYEKAFKYFVSDIRTDLGEIADADLSALPVFVGEISRTSGSAVQNTVNTNNSFIAMQRNLPNVIGNVYVIASGQYDINQLVNGNNVAVGTDSWHWNQADMITIGNLVGQSIIENVLNA